MDVEHLLVQLLGEDGVDALVEAFGKKYLIAHEWRRVLLQYYLQIAQPIVDICPFGVVGKLLQQGAQLDVQLLRHLPVLRSLFH